MLQIKRADIKDATTIALLGRTTFDENFGHLFRDREDVLVYLDTTFSVDKIRKGLQKKENLFWLALWNDLPVGYAKLKLDSPSQFLPKAHSCQLQKIYVLKDFLSLKIGFKLQETLLKAAVQSGYDEIWLSALDSNKRAIRFYEKSGFRKLDTHDFVIGKESFTFFAMAKVLGSE